MERCRSLFDCAAACAFWLLRSLFFQRISFCISNDINPLLLPTMSAQPLLYMRRESSRSKKKKKKKEEHAKVKNRRSRIEIRFASREFWSDAAATCTSSVSVCDLFVSLLSACVPHLLGGVCRWLAQKGGNRCGQPSPASQPEFSSREDGRVHAEFGLQRVPCWRALHATLPCRRMRLHREPSVPQLSLPLRRAATSNSSTNGAAAWRCWA
jgi:hypothetical protein